MSSPSAFQEYDACLKEHHRFLGIVPTRYVKTVYGALHGLLSMLSLVLGNILFIAKVLVGSNDTILSWSLTGTLLLTFFVSNLVSAGITILFFWNKVQSWQLATTSMKEKGLSAAQMQNFNRGRGTIAILLYSLYPLVHATCPVAWLEDFLFSTAFAATLLGLVVFNYRLIRDYSKTLLVVYGLRQAGLAVAILSHGSIATLARAYPNLLDQCETEAVFVVSAVEFGFMWYYAYSRRLVSKETIQEMCKRYHPLLFYMYFGRLQYNSWWTSLPPSMWLQAILASAFAMLFLVKLVKTQLHTNVSEVAITTPSKRTSRRRSSVFEVEGITSRRRSSLFENH